MKQLFYTLAALAMAASPARADFLVGTQPEGNGGFGVGFSFAADVNLVIGQQFSLSSAALADKITVYLNGDGSGRKVDSRCR